MKVSEIMTKEPVCCWPSSSTLSAALLMQETGTGIVAVVKDPFTPVLVGVITDRDLCLHVVAAGRNPLSTWADGCMTQDPVCCTEQYDVSLALGMMKNHQVRRLPGMKNTKSWLRVLLPRENSRLHLPLNPRPIPDC